MLNQENMLANQPSASSDVRVTPEFLANPDLDKLGRALIAAAIDIANQKKADGMT